METLELSENTVNPGQRKVGTYDFELLKVLGKGGYGKVWEECTSTKRSFRHLEDCSQGSR